MGRFLTKLFSSSLSQVNSIPELEYTNKVLIDYRKVEIPILNEMCYLDDRGNLLSFSFLEEKGISNPEDAFKTLKQCYNTYNCLNCEKCMFVSFGENLINVSFSSHVYNSNNIAYSSLIKFSDDLRFSEHSQFSLNSNFLSGCKNIVDSNFCLDLENTNNAEFNITSQDIENFNSCPLNTKDKIQNIIPDIENTKDDEKMVETSEIDELESLIPPKDERQDGYFTIIDEDTKRKIIIPIKNGKIDGIVEWFYPDEDYIKLYQTCVYKDSKKWGKLQSFFTNGKLWVDTNFINGKKDGIEKWYYESGNLNMEIHFKNGIQDGINKAYHENGNLLRETSFKDDKKHGIEKWYYENGNLELETEYKNGKKDGIEKDYHKNGNLKQETTYKDGEIDGTEVSEFRDYYEVTQDDIKLKIRYGNGKKDIRKITSFDKDGNKHGLELEFDKNGKCVKSSIYNLDTLVIEPKISNEIDFKFYKRNDSIFRQSIVTKRGENVDNFWLGSALLLSLFYTQGIITHGNVTYNPQEVLDNLNSIQDNEMEQSDYNSNEIFNENSIADYNSNEIFNENSIADYNSNDYNSNDYSYSDY